MRTAQEFWREMAERPPHFKALLAEKHDLTRRSVERISAVTMFEKIHKHLSDSGYQIFLAGMYLQGNLTAESRLAFEQLTKELERREIEQHLSELPQRKGKSAERIARGL